MIPLLKTSTAFLLDLLFPPRCAVCSRTGAWLCAACISGLPRLLPPICHRCAQPLDGFQRCRKHHTFVALDRLHAVFRFDGSMRDVIHVYKYEGRQVLAEPLGALLATCSSTYAAAAEIVVPVPLHRVRQRERGYNQSALLAEQLARRCRLVYLPGALVRRRETAQQVTLAADERAANVRDAFTCSGTGIAGKTVLLVDDVVTTGSTLEECALALKAAGARAVYGLVLARAGAG